MPSRNVMVASTDDDWEAKQWTAPVNLYYTNVTKLGSQLISIGGGVRVYLNASSGGPAFGKEKNR
jgi:hypothetical protein